MRFQEAFDPFRAIGEAWSLVVRAPLVLLLGGIALVLLTDGGDLFSVWDDWATFEYVAWNDLPDLLIEVLVGSACLVWDVAFLLLACVLKLGLPIAVEHALAHREPEVANLVTTRGRFVPLLVGVLLAAAALAVATLPFALAAYVAALAGDWLGIEWVGLVAQYALFIAWLFAIVYVYLGVFLTEQAVAIEGMEPVDALKRAWSVAEGNRFQLLLYLVILWLLQLSGVILCGVGVFFTGALRNVALQGSYLRFARSSDEQAAWHEGAGAA